MFTLPDLPYDYSSLEPFIDEETMKLHHDKHHAAYIKNVNDALEGMEELKSMDITELLKNLDKAPEKVRTKVINNAGGHYNHSFFWEIMTPPDKYVEPNWESPFAKKLMQDLGSWSGFQEYFKDEALARFGSGWVWLVLEDGKLGVVSTPNQDNPIMDGKNAPILGLDLWEHAYYLKYKNMRADYVEAWWNVVNWKKVEENFITIGGDK